jgi:hypothetical protein
MNLCQFLDFNKDCPVCGEPLTLYAQVLDGPLWKSFKTKTGVYHFEQYKGKNQDFGQDDFFWLINSVDEFDLDFSSAKIYQNSKTWTFFFFFMCNEAGFEDSPSDDYALNPCTACYYRSSPFLEFKQNEDKNWRLTRSHGTDTIEGEVKDEIFSFPVPQPNGGEKMYVLNMDYENKSTILRYFSLTEDQKADKDFDPNIFKLKLPIPNVRPNFDRATRSALISRFDSWILMS